MLIMINADNGSDTLDNNANTDNVDSDSDTLDNNAKTDNTEYENNSDGDFNDILQYYMLYIYIYDAHPGRMISLDT